MNSWDNTLRQIVRHATVFGLGAVLSRLASILLLPLYTRYLRPFDYGTIALVDLTVNLLGIAGGAGIASAATREHYRAESPEDVDRVWCTAVVATIVVATAVFAPAFAFRAGLADLLFGTDVTSGSYFLGLAIPTLWLSVLSAVLDAYFRVQKASTFIVSLGLARLLVNISLNVVLLAWFDGGVAAVLWGNLVASCMTTAVQIVSFGRARTSFVFDSELISAFWRFGWPLAVYGLLSALMHEADRYVLRAFSDLEQVGLYSIAYQIGQGVNTLLIVPFSAIWSVLIYEVEKEDNAPAIYARVFRHFVAGLALVMLFASIFADPILRVLAPPEYLPAARIVPVVCLAYLLFSLHDHFKVPALLARRTVAMLPVVIAAVVVNLVANVLLVPRLGGAGAAWASVITFACFSGLGLVRYRKLAKYSYPFFRCAVIVGGMALTYAAYRMGAARLENMGGQIAIGVVLWLGWASGLYVGLIRDLVSLNNPMRAMRSLLAGNESTDPATMVVGSTTSPRDKGSDRKGSARVPIDGDGPSPDAAIASLTSDVHVSTRL